MPAQIGRAIAHQLPGFAMDYAPDSHQQIAESWPQSIDDRTAQDDWGWRAL